MSAEKQERVTAGNGSAGWILPTVVVLGIALPIAGTTLLDTAFPSWQRSSMPFHSTLEVAGAILGLILAVILLFSKQITLTTRRMWIACALVSMALLDIFHSCVPVGVSFVWLHSLAVLAGGVLFALAWFPERALPRASAMATTGTVMLVTVLVGAFSAFYPTQLPTMVANGEFTPAANAINLLGGGLTVFAALNFGIRYFRRKTQEDLLFLLLTLLFGVSGIIFHMSSVWGPGWWFWHVLRFAAYLFAFWLALFSYRNSENEMVRAHLELDRLFQTAIDGKRLVDRDYNQLRINDTLVSMSGVGRAASEKMKCYEVFHSSLCHTDECPLIKLQTGVTDNIECEVTKTTKDGKAYTCILKAIRLNAPDGSFEGIIESFWDITDTKSAQKELEQQTALKTGQAELSDLMRGDLNIDALCRNVITFLCKYLDAQTGLLYLGDEEENLRLQASYAHKWRKHLATEYKPGEGLVGQAALEKEEIILTEVPEDYISIESGLGEARPKNIYLKPIVHNDRVKAVIELGTLKGFADAETQFFNMVGENIAVAIDSGQSRTKLAQSLDESQRLSEELQSQQEELKAANEELEEQTRWLKDSEEKLKAQHEELQVTNEELEEKNELLGRQKGEVEQARRDIADKADALALASKYKSEFLANMSHELRTPLNSLLLLARSLMENKNGNLTTDQVESASVIYTSGNDLLSLINEILDLSRIEAGRMDLRVHEVIVADLAASTRTSFKHMAEEKGLGLNISVEAGAPACIVSDRKRIEQVIKNLVSNSIKFTETGTIGITFDLARPGTDLRQSGLDPKHALAIVVRDTGIGIAPEQQKLIFEAFQQADGGTSRKYGGSGLGLSIARELVRILGGEIHLSSEPGTGSVFSVFLPVDTPKADIEAPAVPAGSMGSNGRPAAHEHEHFLEIPDDREVLAKTDRAILIIEDDVKFAQILAKQCRELGFKVLAAATGEAGVDLARRFFPRAIVLDLKLPGMDGWRVLELLKEDAKTRHIPIHVVSADEPSGKAMRKGAIGYIQKPVTPQQISAALKKLEDTASRQARKVLVVEDNEDTRKGIIELIADNDVTVDAVTGGGEAIEALRSNPYDCMILDLGLWDFDGDELLKRLEKDTGIDVPPVIVYTARDLTWEEDLDLRSYSDSIIVKDVRSEERLLDEVSLFLHRVVADMPKKKQQVITSLHDTNALLRDKKVLLVDDDMRTLFALSKILSDRGMQIIKAQNGEKAIEVLDQEREVDIVLMDIMMPVLDGYETMKQIRSQDRFKKLPIIALTAKAMKGDQERCIQAGASDYLPKPIDQDRLLSMMRVWLYR
ncbi:MAG: response regulator [Myxococcota bacterium]|nr:response regulator [Myxococcota bacterium]